MKISNKTLAWIFFALKIIIPFLLQDSYYQPHRDEFLYLAEGKHLDWGYMEVPPVLSLFAWLINILGGGEFWIKFIPDLVGGFCYLLVARLIMHLKGGKFALFLAFLPFVLSAFLRVFFLFQPNFIEIFFWTAIGYFLIRYIQTQQLSRLYMFGICLGLGMMSKYTVAFYSIAVFAGLLLTSQRKLFANPHFYGAGAVALLIFLPNLYWQYEHNFPVITHMNELKETQLQFIDPGAFINDQVMMFIPVIFVWQAGLLSLLFSRSYSQHRFYGWAYLVVVALMIWQKGKGYYILGIYPILFAFGATRLEELTKIRFRWTRYAMTLIALGIGGVAVPLLLPVAPPEKLTKYYESIGSYKAGDFKWEDLKSHPLPQDFADMIGWRELTEKTAQVYSALPDAEKKKTMVIASSYAFAGALNYYGPKLGLPQVHSANASFLLWMPEKFEFENMIYVDDEIDDEIPLFAGFRKFTVADSLDMPLFREDGAKVFLYEGATDSVRTRLEGLIRQRKNKFLR